MAYRVGEPVQVTLHRSVLAQGNSRYPTRMIAPMSGRLARVIDDSDPNLLGLCLVLDMDTGRDVEYYLPRKDIDVISLEVVESPTNQSSPTYPITPDPASAGTIVFDPNTQWTVYDPNDPIT